jgi:hypothetical protein
MVSVRADIDSHFLHDFHATFISSKTFVGVGEGCEEAANDALLQAAERFPNADYRTVSHIFNLEDGEVVMSELATRPLAGGKELDA